MPFLYEISIDQSPVSLDRPDTGTSDVFGKIEILFLFGGQTFFVSFLVQFLRPFLLHEDIFLDTDHRDALQILHWTNRTPLFYLSDWKSGFPNHQIH